jgi:MYXO-CTERM domain-containing protein
MNVHRLALFALLLSAASTANALLVRLDDKGLITPTYTEGDLTVSGSDDLFFSPGRVGIVGGQSSFTIDTDEYIDFAFAFGAINVTYRMAQSGCFSETTGQCKSGLRTLEAFAIGGASLGTVQQHGTRDPLTGALDFGVSDVFGDVPIESFRLTHDASLQPTGNDVSLYFNARWLNFDILSQPPTAVDEGGPLPMLLSGLVLLASVRRRHAPG